MSRDDFCWAVRRLSDLGLVQVVDDATPTGGQPARRLITTPQFWERWRVGRFFAPAKVDDDRRPKRKRSRPPADAGKAQADLKLFRDWQASGVSKRELLRGRGIDEAIGLAALDRGRKRQWGSGNKSGQGQ